MKKEKRLRRKHKNKSLNIIIILIVFMLTVFFAPKIISTARYVYNTIHDNYLASQDFYFSSDKLALNHPEFQVTNNWSGAETYRIPVNMSSKRNDMASTAADITYTVTCTCSNNIECILSRSSVQPETPEYTYSGTIVGTDNHGSNVDYFYVYVNPKNGVPLNNTERAWVDITASSTSPYVQVITGKLIIEVGSSNIYYEITDAVNSPYLTVNIINSSPQNANITLAYNPAQVLLDMTDHFYLNSTGSTNTLINNFAYLNSITANVNLLSTTSVKFYKIDPTQNYSYSPSDNTTPIITLSH